ncbi:uncharacterized protein K452DRAFT_265300 [Aplosporella prunicola CBS 121167]|uniref:Glucosamine-6-phosphate isomerase n=1 Tax=Aplosporella prunicola CBS 121167 TaxID=1176127 RepID=A0A6A6BNR4_9PEZI|nr:uncharacterized protein K452DRAFT_265300 [Aplosporella prunicola CBS 121167]KAF2144874.1 hypothetical protein K452DRAFT_265300 [Aplosporella prunicola CBS 121167]
MRLIIREDRQAASQYVADYVVGRIKAFAPTPDRPFVLGLPTGSSPEIVYRLLVQKYKSGDVSFRNVLTFNMDEYVSLPQSHPQSYHTYMYKHLFSHVDIPPRNIHILNGNAPDLSAECAAYERAIVAVGGIELFLAGVGTNGHIAFNEAGTGLSSRTREVVLAPETRAANARFFAATAGSTVGNTLASTNSGLATGGTSAAAVPTRALTVGTSTILGAREVVALATGAHKARAVRHGLEGGVSQAWPLSGLQLHARAVVVVDEAATAELRVRSVWFARECERELGEGAGVGAAPLTVAPPTPRIGGAGFDVLTPPPSAVEAKPTKEVPPTKEAPLSLTIPLSIPLPSPHPSRTPTPEPTFERMGARIVSSVDADADAAMDDDRADAPVLRMGARGVGD